MDLKKIKILKIKAISIKKVISNYNLMDQKIKNYLNHCNLFEEINKLNESLVSLLPFEKKFAKLPI